jgi:hypothetical protein
MMVKQMIGKEIKWLENGEVYVVSFITDYDANLFHPKTSEKLTFEIGEFNLLINTGDLVFIKPSIDNPEFYKNTNEIYNQLTGLESKVQELMSSLEGQEMDNDMFMELAAIADRAHSIHTDINVEELFDTST